MLLFYWSDRGDALWCDILTGDDEYRLPGSDRVKFGKWAASDERYNEIFNVAMREVRNNLGRR